MYEVELKFPLAEAAPVVSRLAALGAEAAPTIEQSDFYFNHPARDFAATDEALRIRSMGQSHAVTYKGPVVDSLTKTRREIEIALEGRDANRGFAEVLTLLGFRPVREVHKTRQSYHLRWDERDFEVSIDQVTGLGTFAEIETLATEVDRTAAIESIQRLAAMLELSGSERKSYLCLLLEKNPKKP